jgi:hypothetical protein
MNATTAIIPMVIIMNSAPINLTTSIISPEAIIGTLKDFPFETKIGRHAANRLGNDGKSPQTKRPSLIRQR